MCDILLFFCTSGLGIGLMFSPPVVVIYDYFDKYKSFASGIAMCGYSVAVVAMLPLLALLIDFYGWQGSMFWLSGIVLNGCVLAFAFRPVAKLKDASEETKTPKDISIQDSKTISSDYIEKPTSNGFAENFEKSSNDLVQNSKTTSHGLIESPKTMSNELQSEETRNEKDTERGSQTVINGFSERSISSVAVISSKEHEAYDHNSNLTKPKKNSVKDMFDLSILKQGTYMLFSFAYACNLFQMMVSYQMYPSKTVSEGMDKVSATLLVSVIGTSAAVSRVVGSVVANFSGTNHVLVFGMCSIVLGLLNIFSFVPSNFVSHAFVVAAMGATVGKWLFV